MADNTTVDNGSGTDYAVATDDIGGVHYQRVKLALGSDGSATDLPMGQQVAGASMPVVLPAAQDPVQTLDAAAVLSAIAHMVAGVRRDADTSPVSSDGDVHPFVFNEVGRLKVAGAPAQIAPVTGSITASTQTVSTDVAQASNVCLYLTGTFAGHNCTFEGSIDGGTSWFTVQCVRTNANTCETSTGSLSAAPVYAWECSVNALTNFRVRATAHTSGTATWRMALGSYATEVVPGIQSHPVTQSGTWNIGTVTGGTGATNIGKARDDAAGSTDTGIATLMIRRDAPANVTAAAGDYEPPQVNSQGAQYVHPTFAGGAGASVAQIVSAASTNATSVKASAGVVTSIAAVNNGTSWRYLKFHNTSSAPTAGSGVVATYGLPPGGGITLSFPSGVGFSSGIGLTITGGIAANDTTAIGASEVSATITYH